MSDAFASGCRDAAAAAAAAATAAGVAEVAATATTTNTTLRSSPSHPNSIKMESATPFSGAPSATSTGPIFWSYSYDANSVPPATAATMAAKESSQVEPIEVEHLNRLVAASMYASIKQSLPYILQTQYNWRPDSGPWFPHEEKSNFAPQQRKIQETKQETRGEAPRNGTRGDRQRPTRGCC